MLLPAAIHPSALVAVALAQPAVAHAAPPVGWVALALLVYAAGAVPLVLWGLARINRSNLAWVALPLLAAIACVGLWFLGRYPPGRPASNVHAVGQLTPRGPIR